MKPTSFDQLPPELKLEIAKHLPPQDLGTLAMTSTNHRTLFQPLVDVSKLLHYVAHSEKNAVRYMLLKEINLILKRGSVTDCSERTFEGISGFEYALWALDMDMCTMILNCIPDNETGHKVLVKLLAQYNKVKTEGIKYTLSGNPVTEKHFDFNDTIIKELRVGERLARGIRMSRDVSVVDQHWRESIGGAQKLIPMHVHLSYYPKPQNSVNSLSTLDTMMRFRQECVDAVKKLLSVGESTSNNSFFPNALSKISQKTWLSSDSKLGKDFALYRGVQGKVVVKYGAPFEHTTTRNLTELSRLFNTKANDFINFQSEFEKRVALKISLEFK
ncbi:F-box protein [Legionella sainthelensi]|uniref:F-box protein n=1 Tax=Legionella sainthelensi TaxID=28087 RepID=UPI000E1FE3D2|nr:F-box protein [Legionella sainthelensi]